MSIEPAKRLFCSPFIVLSSWPGFLVLCFPKQYQQDYNSCELRPSCDQLPQGYGVIVSCIVEFGQVNYNHTIGSNRHLVYHLNSTFLGLAHLTISLLDGKDRDICLRPLQTVEAGIKTSPMVAPSDIPYDPHYLYSFFQCAYCLNRGTWRSSISDFGFPKDTCANSKLNLSLCIYLKCWWRRILWQAEDPLMEYRLH